MIAPERGGSGGRNGDAALLLLSHVIHHGATLVHFTDLVGLAGVVENPFRRRRLAGVDVRHDADVAVTLEGIFAISHVVGFLGVGLDYQR